MSGKSRFAQYNYKKFEAIVKTLSSFQVLRQDNYYLKYLSYDVSREVTPYCDVKPNPFRNNLVRQAIQIGIDRKKLIEELPTYAVPATQPVPPFVFGFNPKIVSPVYDPEQALNLLSQAGLPNGFGVTMYVRQILQETGVLIKQQLSKIGIRVDLKVYPDTEFFEALDRQDSTFFLSRVGATVGDASDVLEPQLHTREPASSYGIRNYFGYSNPQLDQIIRRSAGLLKTEERREALEQAMTILMEDLPWIPLYIDQDVYALENSFQWKPRHDSNVFAYEITLR
jgi:peptide/nickel transport system substrate-binding protein